MAAPPLSVVMGAYNCPAYIGPAIDSILRQTFSDFEFLIIDDGSTDETPAILQRFARRDRRVRVLSAPHAGIVAARNLALHHAAAPLIACMDQDDLAVPDRLAVQVDFLQRHPDIACVGGWHETMDAAARPIRVLQAPADHEAIDAAQLEGVTCIAHATACYRAPIARQAGGYRFESELAEDLDLWLRMAEIGRLAILPQVLLRYRVHDGSSSSLHHQRQLAAVRAACAAAWTRRGLPPRPLATQRWRPDATRLGRAAFDTEQGWSAFLSGHRSTAIACAARSLSRSPMNAPTWKLLACAMLRPCKARIN